MKSKKERKARGLEIAAAVTQVVTERKAKEKVSKEPLRISFDIGGVLSKYPEVFRPMVNALLGGGAEVFVITDMKDHDKAVKFVRGNGYDIKDENILNSDYAEHGEMCKAKTVDAHGIHIHIDDFPGYVANQSCVNLFVWPNPHKPYYSDEFITDGSEGDFGRRKKLRKVAKIPISVVY